MGTNGLVVQAQSLDEIYADKLVAFALRPNRIKYRDLWDIIWLHQQGRSAEIKWIKPKLQDRNIIFEDYLMCYNLRKLSLTQDSSKQKEFEKEMQRFLPIDVVKKTIVKKDFWTFIIYLMNDLEKTIINFYSNTQE